MASLCAKITCILALGVTLPVAHAEDIGRCDIQLTNVTAETGIEFQHTNGGSGENYIVEFMSAGLALFDYNGDGWIDIYFLNGAPLKGTSVDVAPRNALYRNNGDWTFTDVSEQVGAGDPGFGLGLAAGDYDNDGDQDLYLNNFGPNVLYRNDGDGTFSDVTDQAGVRNGDKVGAGACFLDVEGDGDLDLFVGNYVHFQYDEKKSASRKRREFFSGPQDYAPMPDNLFRNNGDGTFTDISTLSGIDSTAGTTMGMISFDYQEDGDSDIFLCNDAMPNFLFQNDGEGNFKEVALLAGLAYNYMGIENGSMGADCGDYDNDGLLDLFMTNYMHEMPVLYRNLDRGIFEDSTNVASVGGHAFPETTWGSAFVDFDSDGDHDLFIATGHFGDSLRKLDDRSSFRAANLLLMNLGKGKFTDVSNRCGNGLAVVESSRGAAFDDLDNDGDVDAVVLNVNARPTILRNDSNTEQHWLELRLKGVRSNRDGVGARVRVVAGDLTRTAEVHSGRSYQSHFGTRLHFGLGTRERVDLVKIRWIGGGTDVFGDLAIDRIVTLTEGTGH